VIKAGIHTLKSLWLYNKYFSVRIPINNTSRFRQTLHVFIEVLFDRKTKLLLLFRLRLFGRTGCLSRNRFGPQSDVSTTGAPPVLVMIKEPPPPPPPPDYVRG
jgi:hypothetical protein